MQELQIFGKEITLLNPEFLQFKWLLLGLFGIVGLFFLWRFRSRPKTTLGSKYPWLNSFAFWGLAVVVSAAFVAALARPVTRDSVRTEKESIDVLFMVDNSLSMRAADMGSGSYSTRLSVAKRDIMSLLEDQVLSQGDRAGLFVLGKQSVLPMPLTSDLGAFVNSVQNISFPEKSLKNETVWGTNLPVALQHVGEILNKEEQFVEDFDFELTTDDRPTVLFVLTDGNSETFDEEKFRSSLEELQSRDIKIYSIGIGSREGVLWTSLLRGYTEGEDYPPEYVRDWDGKVTRLETGNLSEIASATGGELAVVTGSDQSSEPFMKEAIDENRSSKAVPIVDAENKFEFWYYITLGAMIFLMLAVLII